MENKDTCHAFSIAGLLSFMTVFIKAALFIACPKTSPSPLSVQVALAKQKLLQHLQQNLRPG